MKQTIPAKTEAVEIQKRLHARIREKARKYGISESAYIRDALVRALESEKELEVEMRPWEEASLRDFDAFARKHNV